MTRNPETGSQIEIERTSLLTLKKEIVRQLAGAELALVGGGARNAGGGQSTTGGGSMCTSTPK